MSFSFKGKEYDIYFLTQLWLGRILSKRCSSSKLFFYDVHHGSLKVQVMADARKSELDEAEFARLHASVKRGDFVGVTGFPGSQKI